MSDFDAGFIKNTVTVEDEYDPSQALGAEEEELCQTTMGTEVATSEVSARRSPSPEVYIPTKKAKLQVMKKKESTERRPRKQKMKETAITLMEVIQLYLPVMMVGQYQMIRAGVNELIRATGTTYANNKDLQLLASQFKTQLSLMETLTVIASIWRRCVSTKCSSTNSLQDCVLNMEEEGLSSLLIELPHAMTLAKYFEHLLTQDEHKASRINTETTPSSPQAYTDYRTGTMSTSSTHAVGTDIPAVAEDCSPFATLGSAPSDTLGPSNPFLPKTSNALRSITWQMGSTNCTARWAKNTGDYIVKMEVYRWSEVKVLPSREWWRHAVHRSQVFGNAEEDHIKLAMQRDRMLQGLWLDPQRGWTPRHQGVDTFGEMRQAPKCFQPQNAPGQQWQPGNYW